MANFPFKINIDLQDGTQHTYYTSSFATDTESLVSASIMVNKINAIPEGNEYIQSIKAVNMHSSRNFSGTGEGITWLSASFTEPNTGSIVFTDTESQTNDGLKFYTFWGSKVCSVLGLSEGIPIYPENFKLSDNASDPDNYLSGDVIANSISIKEGFKMAPQARMRSSLVWDDAFGEGYVQWVSGSSTKLALGFNVSSSKYEFKGTNIQMSGVSHLKAGGFRFEDNKITAVSTDDIIISTNSAGAGDLELLTGRSTFDWDDNVHGQLKLTDTGINYMAGNLRIRDDNDDAFDNTAQKSEFQLYLQNRQDDESDHTGHFAGIAFDVGTENDTDSLMASIVAVRDVSANDDPTLHDGNLVFSTNDAGDDGNTERVRITHDGLVGIGSNDPAVALDVVGAITSTSDITTGGDVVVSGDIVHNGDTDTKIAFGTNDISFQAGAQVFMDMNNGSSPYSLIINEGSDDMNFRVENNVNAYGIYSDGGRTNVMVGSNASLPSLIIESTSTGDAWTAQGAQIVIGESAGENGVDAAPSTGHAALYLTYRGDGYGYIGMGGTDTGTAGIPNQGYIRFIYNGTGVFVGGALSKTSGTFTIKHPDPAKSGSMALQHSFVESPTRGDNIYTYVVSSSADNQTVVTDLPSYWEFLNENPRMWIQAKGMFAQAYGEVSSSLKQFSVTMERAGSYDVMIIGTRKDADAVRDWEGIEVSNSVLFPTMPISDKINTTRTKYSSSLNSYTNGRLDNALWTETSASLVGQLIELQTSQSLNLTGSNSNPPWLDEL